jgi:hypothetical protein
VFDRRPAVIVRLCRGGRCYWRRESRPA